MKDLLIKLGLSQSDETSISKAFVHRSYLNEHKQKIESNERLEFLGDSILSFIVSEYLFSNFEGFPEGKLTNIRSSIVKTSTLADVAKKLGIGKFLKLSKGEEESGGRNNQSLLADALEALIGAVYLSFGLKKTSSMIMNLLIKPYLPDIIKDQTFKDAKSLLQEKVQERLKISPLYKVINEEGPDHAKIFTIAVIIGSSTEGTGKGKNKQEAEQNAALQALVKWSKS